MYIYNEYTWSTFFIVIQELVAHFLDQTSYLIFVTFSYKGMEFVMKAMRSPSLCSHFEFFSFKEGMQNCNNNFPHKMWIPVWGWRTYWKHRRTEVMSTVRLRSPQETIAFSEFRTGALAMPFIHWMYHWWIA